VEQVHAIECRVCCGALVFNQGETDMGDKGSKDKGKREQQKKAQRTPKEKKQLKREKRNK
jgi:hypothetical protein